MKEKKAFAVISEVISENVLTEVDNLRNDNLLRHKTRITMWTSLDHNEV